MVILIGGSSHVGKTLISNELMKKHSIPYLSLDHLKMGFIRSHLTDLTPEDDYELRYFMWPFVSEIIKTVVENSQNLIVEGCYIPGEWQSAFSQEYLKHIRSVFIVMSEQYLRGHFQDVCNYAEVIESRKEDLPDLQRLIGCSKMFKDSCLEYNIPFYEIDQTYSLEDILEKIEILLNLQETI